MLDAASSSLTFECGGKRPTYPSVKRLGGLQSRSQENCGQDTITEKTKSVTSQLVYLGL